MFSGIVFTLACSVIAWRLGELSLSRSGNEPAIALAESLVDDDPEQAGRIFFEGATALHLTDQLPEAEEWLEQVLDEFPEDIGALNDLGYLWADQNKHLERALAMVSKAVAAEPDYDRASDPLRMLFYPLHVTSFCLTDVLQMNDWYGASQVIIVSASSKTSIGLAYGLDMAENAPSTVAVTSAGNRNFVASLQLYSTTVTYDDVTAIDAAVPAVIVDMSGNDRALSSLADHLGDNMRQCVRVGVTHHDAATGEAKTFGTPSMRGFW